MLFNTKAKEHSRAEFQIMKLCTANNCLEHGLLTISQLDAWSSGMVLAQGAGGPGPIPGAALLRFRKQRAQEKAWPSSKADWSSCMIPASGARGPGLNSQNSLVQRRSVWAGFVQYQGLSTCGPMAVAPA